MNGYAEPFHQVSRNNHAGDQQQNKAVFTCVRKRLGLPGISAVDGHGDSDEDQHSGQLGCDRKKDVNETLENIELTHKF